MAQITAQMVKALRDETQLPMMECKKALAECDGDTEAAKKWLRERGQQFMGKRADRSTEEGRMAIYADVDGETAAMVELQCESAPVAGNEEFVALANDLARQLATGPGATTPDQLWQQPSPSKAGLTLAEQRDEVQNKIREVFRLARLLRIDAPCGGYVHHDGKTGVLLAVEQGDAALAKDICMHIAAMRPAAISVAELDPAVVENERAILTQAAKKEGKPEKIIERMVEGRMRNFFAECVLSEQPFVKDDKQTVGKVAAAKGMKLLRFACWQLGESAARPPRPRERCLCLLTIPSPHRTAASS
jgi:elongation factor Ts